MYPIVKDHSCPWCGGMLVRDADYLWEELVCCACSRRFDKQLQPVRVTPDELKERYNIRGVWIFQE